MALSYTDQMQLSCTRHGFAKSIDAGQNVFEQNAEATCVYSERKLKTHVFSVNSFLAVN